MLAATVSGTDDPFDSTAEAPEAPSGTIPPILI
jgi:hypothetical protein